MALPMENTEKMIFPGVGKYGIPEIKPETDIRIDKLEWIPVNYALTAKDKATKGVHFYKDDYQFERFWNNPDKYIQLLQQFGAVCSPDFSLYSDMPLSVQLFMHYKKHWLAAYWQAHGIHVIPTLCWCGEQSYDWCFCGEPRNAIVSISSHGTQSDPYEAECFAKRMTENGATVKTYTKKQLAAHDEARRKENANKPDYEMGIGVPWGNKNNRKAARVSRLAGRVQRRRR